MKGISRRAVVKSIVGGTAAVLTSPVLAMTSCNNSIKRSNNLKGNINHSVCRWTFEQLQLDELCNKVKEIGFAAIDLVGPADWNTLKKHVVVFRAMEGINAVVVGIMGAATILLFMSVPSRYEWLNLMAVLVTFFVLQFTRIPSPIIVLAFLLMGWIL